MKNQILFGTLFLLVPMLPLIAQEETDLSENSVSTCAYTGKKSKPVDGLLEKSAPPLLQYDFIQERDVMWEKRIWRELNLAERMNQHFSYQKEPFINILLEEAKAGNLTLYSAIDDQFSTELSVNDISCIGGSYDTVRVYDPITYTDSFVVVRNDFNPNDVRRYRLKEVWYFDSRLSKMNVRILGIAPIVNRYDEAGRLIAEIPLFWIYYPDARPILAQHKVFNPHNDASAFTWDDVFLARYFSSLIVKESNVHDRRISDYAEGVQALYEADKIHNEMFNYEQDMWDR